MGNIAYVFPGQGVQFRGMGRELLGQFPEQVAIADRVLGYSLEALCVSDESERLNETKYTQPTIYVVSVLCYPQALRDGLPEPDFSLGHSLGEYCALFAAGALTLRRGSGQATRRAHGSCPMRKNGRRDGHRWQLGHVAG
jgi:malonyl CoA-acyl carrier protein transacylase